MATATSGSGTSKVTSYDTLKVSWTLDSQSTTNNTSTITFKAQLVSTTYGKISSTASKSYTATINGTTYSGTNTVGISANSTLTLFSKQLTISHSSDGTLSFTFSFKQAFNITFSGSSIGSVTASCTVNPTSIARASSITSASAVELGNACSVKWTPLNSSYAYTLTFTIGSTSKTTSKISPGTTSAYTYSGYTFALGTWAASITTATSATCTVVLKTYTSSSSSTSIGSSSKTFTVTVPSSVIPTVSIGSIAEAGGVTIGVYVQNKSKLKVTFTGTSIYSSALKSYTLKVGSLTYTGTPTSGTAVSVTSDTLTSSGTITISVTVTDARGRTSSTASQTVSVSAYTVPSITTFSATRCDEDGNTTSDGTYVNIKYVYTCSSGISSNSATFTIKSKVSTDSSYSTTVTSGSGLTGSATIRTDEGYSNSSSYNFQITVTDSLSTSTATITLSSAIYPISVLYDGNGVAFGKVADTTLMVDVAWPMRCLDQLIINTDSGIANMIDLTNTGSEGNTYLRATSFTGTRVSYGVGSGGYNRGIYDNTAGCWMIYRDSNNRTYLDGNGTYYHPYWQAGDSFSFGVYTAGFITNSGTDMRFMIPLTMPIIGSSSVSVSGSVTVRQNNSYLYGSSADDSVTPSSYTATYTHGGIRVNAVFGNTTNVTNNSPCGIAGTFTITIS